MRVYREVSGSDFEFLSEAKITVKYLTEEEIDRIFDELESINCDSDGMYETEVNDFFWFKVDTIAKWLGWPDFETLMEARSDGNWFDSYAEYEEFLEENEEEEEEE